MTNLPVTGTFRITATYGQRGPYWKDGHKGIDFTDNNHTIYSTCYGTVRVVSYDAAAGASISPLATTPADAIFSAIWSAAA